MSQKMEGLVVLTVISLFAAWVGYYRFEDPLAPKFQDSGKPASFEVRAAVTRTAFGDK